MSASHVGEVMKFSNKQFKSNLENCVELDDIELHWKILRNFKDAHNYKGVMFQTGYLHGYLEGIKAKYRGTSIADEIQTIARLLDHL
jgi:hypothetical protein